MNIGVTGATGFIGSHLTEELVRRGHAVTCLVRPTSNLQWIRGLPIRPVRVCAGSPADLARFVRGLDVLVHAAGSKFAASRRDFETANEHFTDALLAAVRLHGTSVRRFVYLSSMAVTGPSPDGRPLAEDQPPNPITSYGFSKLRTEELIARRCGPLPYTILRPPGVYGPRDRDILMVFQMAHRGVQLVIGRRNVVDLIYVRNLVDAICLVVDAKDGTGGVYHVADEQAYTWASFTRQIQAAQGRGALTLKIPGPLLSAAGWVGQRAASWVGGEIKLNDQKVREMKAPYWRISSDRARAELGYQARFSGEQGIAETVEWYRAHRWL